MWTPRRTSPDPPRGAAALIGGHLATPPLRSVAAFALLALLALLVLFAPAGASAARLAAHPTAVPAKVAPYPVTAEPAKVTPYRATARHGAERPRDVSALDGPQPCTGPGSITAAQSGYGFGYLANQVAQAYELTPLYRQGDEGQGQTIALLELEPNSAADIAAYQGCYGTDTTVNYLAVHGGVNGDGNTDTTDPGSGEAALDIEQIIGLAPKATIDVYQAPNTAAGILAAYHAIVANPSVTVISTSWGACEADNPLTTVEPALFAKAAQDGVSTFAAAGDNGSTDCGTSALAVDDPASQADVTGVGGTSMPNIAAVDQQYAWNGSGIGDGVTGGGFSSLWTEPSWQQAAAAQAQSAAAAGHELTCPAASAGGYCRAVPDVSANADPYTGYIIYLTENVTDPQTGASTPELTASPWGGTSAAAPLWAAIAALSNASPACNGHNLGPLDPLLYQVAVKAMPGLTNITTGDNDDTADDPIGYFSAARGYSPVTGLGTPQAAPLAQSLCADADTISLNAPAAVTSISRQPVDLNDIAASDAQGHQISYGATQLPTGLAINPSTGAITGTPTVAATFDVRVTVTAAENSATKTTVIPWTVSTPAAATPPQNLTTTTTGEQHGAGGTPKRPIVELIHITRRYRGHTVHITLEVSTRGGQIQLLIVSVSATGKLPKMTLPTIELLLPPRPPENRSATPGSRPVRRQPTHQVHARPTAPLPTMPAGNEFALKLNYAGGRHDLIALPRL